MSELRAIADLAGCRAVVELQIAVWGADAETVPASVLLVSAKRGGILVGAFDGGALVGFVWSMPGWRDGRPTHWSHMLAVSPAARGRGIGEALKRAQRDRALAQQIDLVEWTFDPLQAQNAHLNLARLGAVASTYLADAYGAMSGPLHRGTPTDRLVAEWWIRRPHVERRLERGARLTARSADVAGAPLTIETRPADPWVECVGERCDLDASRLLVPVPPRFTEMQQQARDSAASWRAASRAVFSTYFARGYVAVDFFLDREGAGGHYLLASQAAMSEAAPRARASGRETRIDPLRPDS